VLEMQASSYVFGIVFQNIFIILIIIFQQEIRQVLEKVGKSKFTGISWLLRGNNSEKDAAVKESIIEIAKAVQRMGDAKIGSLIVMEKEMLLGDVIKTGKLVDAKITHELVGNIFFPKSPLHDGAAVVRDGRLYSAGCVLPLTKSDDVSSDLGTRHRAALGMSEQSDAMVIVSSEETGIISIAYKGNLTRDLTESELREMLINYFVDDSNDKGVIDSSILTKIFKGKKK
jgi:diadenylate cyclase